MGRSIVDAAEEGHRGLNREAAKITLQIVEMHGLDKYTCSSILYVHAG